MFFTFPRTPAGMPTGKPWSSGSRSGEYRGVVRAGTGRNLTSPNPEGSAPRPSGTGGLQTHRWREMASNFQFLVASPSEGGRDSSLENESGPVAEPKVRIHLPPAASPLRTLISSPFDGHQCTAAGTDGMARRHPVAVAIKQHAGEQARLATSALNGALGAVLTAGHPENSWL